MRHLAIPSVLRARIKRLRDTEAGQTLVEFTLVLPLFLCLLFAMVDFGRGFYGWLVVTNAAREGARSAAVQSPAATVDAAVWGSFCNPYPGNCALDNTKVAISKSGVQGARGTTTSVTVTYTFSYVTPIGSLVSLLGGSTLSAPVLTSTSSMRLE